MSHQDDCKHSKINRVNEVDAIWGCLDCSTEFLPAEVAQELEAGLEIAAAQMALVMVQYTERMTDRYGPLQEQEPEDPCKDGHDMDQALGKCRRCDYSPFMGGGT